MREGDKKRKESVGGKDIVREKAREKNESRYRAKREVEREGGSGREGGVREGRKEFAIATQEDAKELETIQKNHRWLCPD